MFKTVYVLKLNNPRYLDRLIKYHIYFLKIKYYQKYYLLYVDKTNYQKILKYFKIYDITLYKVKGYDKYGYLLKKYHVFLFSLILGIIELFLLSKVIFKVQIMTNNEEIIGILNKELDKVKIKKYYFVKSYLEKEKIKKDILKNYQDQIEWLEIDLVGCNYYVKVLERKQNHQLEDTSYQNVVAKRNAVIKEIKAESGQIVKKVNDYVNRGDTIISGNIIKNDEIKDIVRARGKIYGETWYNVRVELPHTYTMKSYTGNVYRRFTIDFLAHRFYLFGKKKYQYKKEEDNPIFQSSLLPLQINRTTILEIKEAKAIYTYDEAYNRALSLAREKLKYQLPVDSKILLQKKLKLYEENSKIIVEVFFKVYEDITDYEKILVEGE